MSPEFFAGLILLIIGTWVSAFPRDREYLTRLINLEIPAFGLLLVAGPVVGLERGLGAVDRVDLAQRVRVGCGAVGGAVAHLRPPPA